MNALDNANIQDKDSKGLTSFALPEAKSSKTGVSVRYALSSASSAIFMAIKFTTIKEA